MSDHLKEVLEARLREALEEAVEGHLEAALEDHLEDTLIEGVTNGRLVAKCSECSEVLSSEDHGAKKCPTCGPLLIIDSEGTGARAAEYFAPN